MFWEQKNSRFRFVIFRKIPFMIARIFFLADMFRLGIPLVRAYFLDSPQVTPKVILVVEPGVKMVVEIRFWALTRARIQAKFQQIITGKVAYCLDSPQVTPKVILVVEPGVKMVVEPGVILPTPINYSDNNQELLILAYSSNPLGMVLVWTMRDLMPVGGYQILPY
jgi:hypothetical protein